MIQRRLRQIGKLLTIIRTPFFRRALRHGCFSLVAMDHLIHDSQGFPVQADFLFKKAAT